MESTILLEILLQIYISKMHDCNIDIVFKLYIEALLY